MGRYATLQKEFGFLAKTYGFEIWMKQKHGAYYYITWMNQNTKIKVLYVPHKSAFPGRVYEVRIKRKV